MIVKNHHFEQRTTDQVTWWTWERIFATIVLSIVALVTIASLLR